MTPTTLQTAQLSYNSARDAAALETAKAVYDGECTLYRIHVSNTGAAAFFQLWDEDAVPVATTIPQHAWALPANDALDIDFGPRGLKMSEGIAISLSSTHATRTAMAANAYFDVRYTTKARS